MLIISNENVSYFCYQTLNLKSTEFLQVGGQQTGFCQPVESFLQKITQRFSLNKSSTIRSSEETFYVLPGTLSVLRRHINFFVIGHLAVVFEKVLLRSLQFEDS